MKQYVDTMLTMTDKVLDNHLLLAQNAGKFINSPDGYGYILNPAWK